MIRIKESKNYGSKCASGLYPYVNQYIACHKWGYMKETWNEMVFNWTTGFVSFYKLVPLFLSGYNGCVPHRHMHFVC